MDYIIVQAGGKGTRLKYLTENKPKGLVPVNNLPMLFHLFEQYSDKRFVIIADYKKEVMRKYLEAFAKIKYQVVDAAGTGTCAGISQALELIPEAEPFMLVWSDLILPDSLELPAGYRNKIEQPKKDFVGISEDFPCRWSYENSRFKEVSSSKHGVAGFFLFRDKSRLAGIPDSGELVRWLQQQKIVCDEVGLSGTKEFGLIEEYEKLEKNKCRPFNKISIEGDVLTKYPIGQQGEKLAARECAWYEKAKQLKVKVLPEIYGTSPLTMEFIKGKNIYEYSLGYEQKKEILEQLIFSLQQLHTLVSAPVDTFSIKENYYYKTMARLEKIQDLVPFARDREIIVNGRKCRNVFFYRRELEDKLEKLVLNCTEFVFIHGDCTFSNMMLRDDGRPVLIDPRGYFGFTELYGDVRYDWAKVYYSIVGNYDRFNLKEFSLHISDEKDSGVQLDILSNEWEDMENLFFELTGANEIEIKLLHAVIWLSLTTYAWQDYDSICGAFYNGLWYLEEVL